MWAMWSILMCQPMVCQGTTLLTSLAIQTDHIPHAPIERATHIERASSTEPHIQSSRGRDDHIRRVTRTWGNVWAAADHWSAFNQTSNLSSFWQFSILTHQQTSFLLKVCGAAMNTEDQCPLTSTCVHHTAPDVIPRVQRCTWCS